MSATNSQTAKRKPVKAWALVEKDNTTFDKDWLCADIYKYRRDAMFARADYERVIAVTIAPRRTR